jgi:hypothetical protein
MKKVMIGSLVCANEEVVGLPESLLNLVSPTSLATSPDRPQRSDL